MKKKLLLGLFILGSLSYGASSVTDNAQVEIEVFKAATLVVDDIDFTKWMIGQTPGALKSNIKITTGRASATMTLSTPISLTLTHSVTPGDTMTATMDIIGTGTSNDTATHAIHKITLNSSGEYDGELQATLGVIGASQKEGKYSGTATVSLTYN